MTETGPLLNQHLDEQPHKLRGPAGDWVDYMKWASDFWRAESAKRKARRQPANNRQRSPKLRTL